MCARQLAKSTHSYSTSPRGQKIGYDVAGGHDACEGEVITGGEYFIARTGGNLCYD